MDIRMSPIFHSSHYPPPVFSKRPLSMEETAPFMCENWPKMTPPKPRRAFPENNVHSSTSPFRRAFQGPYISAPHPFQLPLSPFFVHFSPKTCCCMVNVLIMRLLWNKLSGKKERRKPPKRKKGRGCASDYAVFWPIRLQIVSKALGQRPENWRKKIFRRGE